MIVSFYDSNTALRCTFQIDLLEGAPSVPYPNAVGYINNIRFVMVVVLPTAPLSLVNAMRLIFTLTNLEKVFNFMD